MHGINADLIGMKRFFEWYGVKVDWHTKSDSSAARSMALREGVGRVRHLDIGVLWLQEQQLRRIVELTKVLGTSNPADLKTKHLGQESLKQNAEVLRYDFRQGRSVTTARLHPSLIHI